MKKALFITVLACLALSACLLCSCGKEEQSAVPLNSSLENVTLPAKGKLYYDIQVEDEGITYRNVFYKNIKIGEAKSYAQNLYSSGFTKQYEDASTKDFFGFSATYEKGSQGVSISGYWTEEGLSLTILDIADAKAILEADDAEARQKSAEAAAEGDQDDSSEDEGNSEATE